VRDDVTPVVLLEQARGGNEIALGKLLELYRNYLRLVARSLISSALRVKLEPSDLVQETFLKAHREFAQFAGQSEPELVSWLRRILVRSLSNQVKHHRRMARDHQRQESLEQLLDRSSSTIQQALATSISSPSEQASRREPAVLLADALNHLPEDYREVFIRCTLEHIPFETIAADMGRSVGAVRMLWGRAVKQLTQMLEEGVSLNGAPVPSGTEDDESLDSELARALETYLGAVEAGRPVDLEQLAAEHPAIAEQIRSCLGVLRLAGRVEGKAEADTSCDVGDGLAQPALLGDFRLLRPIGRGGMGIVYEAEQVSLQRQVALKVLPFAAALDQQQLQRFKTEAQAAAHLHHTNIVPVFAVGCERGVHFYAMQFIEGQTLAALIRDLRRLEGLEKNSPATPTATWRSLADEVVSGRLAPSPPPTPASDAALASTVDRSLVSPQSKLSLSSTPSTRSRAFFRTVAQFGIQAAEALDYAHRMGIVHRDIKPANLLVDARGNLWVTDFGLAQMQTDNGLTITGDVLGTLRYMSPEQAQGRRAIVDHRTDIYSLGTTLYEVLTLRAAFAGQDRHEVLRKIAEEEPPPPRLLNQSVPRDLETIVLKAMARDVCQRYATARDLADDLGVMRGRGDEGSDRVSG